MPLDDVEAVGREAYLWGWPLVNVAKRVDRAAFVTQGGNPVLVDGTPVGYGQLVMLNGFVRPTERLICCPSHDVAYGSGVFDLSQTPVVIQVPDFGNRFWLYAFYDARTNEFSQIGKQYNTTAGFHLLVGPDWNDQPPAGIDRVWQCPTNLAIAIPRIYTDGTTQDLQAIQLLLQQICSYPLAQFNQTMVTRDWDNLQEIDPILLQGRGQEARFVKPELFIEELRAVMASVPPLPGEEDLYSRINDVLDRARLNLLVRLALKNAFRNADSDTIAPLMQWASNGVAVGNGWYSSVRAAEWSVEEYSTRTATAKSNMFENRAEETKYYFTDTDSSGELLDGSQQYAITFAKDQLLRDHARGFWSISLYDEFHFFNTVTNPIGRYSLGTKDEGSLTYNNDGSLTLYAGAAPPQQGSQNWLPAPVSEPFSLYVRAYWPDQVILDGHWQPPKIVKL